MSVLQTLVQVIAEVDSLQLIVNGHGMKEIVPLEMYPVHEYWKFVFKRIVSELVGVVVRISVQLIYVRSPTRRRSHSAHQCFLHVG